MAIYDSIGQRYAIRRRPEPAILEALKRALGQARTVVNVGAGAGSYEPDDREIVAAEPSLEMIRQRPEGSAPAHQAAAESLPFKDGSFAAALGVLTMHHWSNLEQGLREMKRVARERIVLLTWDPSHPGFWLTRDYFPDIRELDARIFPSLTWLTEELGPGGCEVLPIPHDCRDGFLGAYWRRPASYVDPSVRAAMSTFSKISSVEPRIEQLAADLDSGRWQAHNQAIVNAESLDLGYRILVFERSDAWSRAR